MRRSARTVSSRPKGRRRASSPSRPPRCANYLGGASSGASRKTRIPSRSSSWTTNRLPICPRCGLGIGPDDLWDLGHDDYNPRIERPEHRSCNRAAANQLKTSTEW
jgi:hypothetical protein